MKISIITVSYNSSLTISRTIESVLSQKNIDLEYIIIDGASKDGTVDIIRQYAEKNPCIKWVSEKDKGIYDAMNKGIGFATGEVIGILNSDDYYAGDTVLRLICDEFDNTKTDMVYGDIIYVKNKIPYRYWKSGKSQSFYTGWMPPHPALFIKKSVYDTYGIFRLDCGVNADYEIMLRFFEKEKISSCWIHKTITFMEAGGTSNSGLKSRMEGITDNIQAWKVNGLKPKFYTIFFKKIRKIPQYVVARFFRFSREKDR